MIRSTTMSELGRCLLLLLAASSLMLEATSARSASHLWRFSEFYSSPDGSIQFIEMEEILGSPIETQISNHWYQTNTYNLDHGELLGSDLVGNTAHKQFLVGTPSLSRRC